MIDWNKLIEDKREEISTDQDPSHGMFDFDITSNDLIELAVIDFRTFELTGTRGGRI